MKFVAALIIGLTLQAQASAFTSWRDVQDINIQAMQEELDQDMDKIISAFEESLAWRVEMIEKGNSLREYLESDEPLTQEIQNEVIKQTGRYFQLRNKLLLLIDKYKKYLTDYHLELTNEEPSQIYYKIFKWPMTRKSTLRINPDDALGKIFTKQLKISLASALVLYDNYLIGVSNFTRNKKIRKKINDDYPRRKKALDDVEDNYYKWENRILMRKALRLFKKEQKYIADTLTDVDQNSRFLNTLITSSPSFDSLYNFDEFISESIEGRLKKRHKQRKDIMREVLLDTTNAVSKVFGNTVGLVEERKGLMYGDEALTNHIQSQLKPLDILFEKTPFRLTDTFIPGHWGHAAIWIGTEDELRQIKRNGISIWENLEIEMINIYGPSRGVEMTAKIKKDIRSNKLVLEALRPGVMLNDLKHFMNIDDLGVMRRTEEFELTDEEKYEYLVHAFKQVGKEYDFNFDVETDDKIVCSELIYKVYPYDEWPVEDLAGRWTISPDNVAQLSVNPVEGNYQYDVSLLYSNGVKLSGDNEMLREKMDILLKHSYDAGLDKKED